MTFLFLQTLLIVIFSVASWLPQKHDHLDIVSYPVIRTVEAGTLCGMYSLKAAGSAVGTEIANDELFDIQYLSSPFGSTADDILRAANDHGIKAKRLYGPDLGLLLESNRPAMLLLASKNQEMGHWVTFLGPEEDGLRIYDPSVGLQIWHEGELMARWSGITIVVGAESDVLWWPVMGVLKRITWLFVPFMVVILVLKYKPGRSVGSERNETPKSLWSYCKRVSILLCVAAVWWLAWLATCESHPFRQQHIAGEIGCNEAGINPEIPYVDLTTKDQIQLIDCRLPLAFAYDHLVGAENIPIDCQLNELRSRLQNLDRFQDTVVYCQNEDCQWAIALSSKLKCMGFKHVAVLDGGFDSHKELALSSVHTSADIQ